MVKAMAGNMDAINRLNAVRAQRVQPPGMVVERVDEARYQFHASTPASTSRAANMMMIPMARTAPRPARSRRIPPAMATAPPATFVMATARVSGAGSIQDMFAMPEDA